MCVLFFWYSGTCHRSFIVLESKTQYCSLSLTFAQFFVCLQLIQFRCVTLNFARSRIDFHYVKCFNRCLFFFLFYCNLHTINKSQCVFSTIANISMETKSVQNCLEHIYVLTIIFVVLRLIVHKITLKHHTQISNRICF